MLKNRIAPTKAQEAAEDIFFGQIAIIWARWFLIAAGAIITLSTADDQFMTAVITLVILMTMNFFFHGRYMTGKPVNQFLLLFGNMVDLGMITALVIFGNAHQTGVNSNFFVLYYPMLFTWALVFSPRITIVFSAITLALYTMACLFFSGTPLMLDGAQIHTLIANMITLGAMSGLGTYYYRRQRDSLRALVAAKASPLFQ